MNEQTGRGDGLSLGASPRCYFFSLGKRDSSKRVIKIRLGVRAVLVRPVHRAVGDSLI